MGFSKTLKTNAKRALAGNWGRAIGIMLITAIPTFLINMLEFGIRRISGVQQYMDYAGTPSVAFDDMANVAWASVLITVLVTLLLFIVMTPLSQGTLRWYYRRTGGEEEGVSTVFHYFETAQGYFKSLWLHFQIGLRMFLWTILLSIPFGIGAVVFIMAGTRSDGTMSYATRVFGLLLVFVWVILLTILTALISLRYFLAPYLLAEHPDFKGRKSIKQGIRYIRGYKGRVFLFQLSFIGWFIPAILAVVLVFALPFIMQIYWFGMIGLMLLLLLVQFGLLFYVTPYMQASYAMYARYLIQLAEGGAEQEESYSDTTREYIYKPEIDRYMEEQERLSDPNPPDDPEDPNMI